MTTTCSSNNKRMTRLHTLALLYQIQVSTAIQRQMTPQKVMFKIPCEDVYNAYIGHTVTVTDGRQTDRKQKTQFINKLCNNASQKDSRYI